MNGPDDLFDPEPVRAETVEEWRGTKQGADEDRGADLAELERLRAVVADYERGIVWDTTCIQCAETIERAHSEYERAERLRAVVAAVAALCADHYGTSTEYEHVTGCCGEPTCPACWVADIRAALNSEQAA